MVGRFVEQQGLGVAEQDPGELDPSSLPSRERADGLLQYPICQPQAGRDAGGFGLCGVTTGRRELGVEPRVAAHRAVSAVVVGARHATFSRRAADR